MARALRIEFSGALYHVTSRGNEQRPIFPDADRIAFLDFLAQAARIVDTHLEPRGVRRKHGRVGLQALLRDVDRSTDVEAIRRAMSRDSTSTGRSAEATARRRHSRGA